MMAAPITSPGRFSPRGPLGIGRFIEADDDIEEADRWPKPAELVAARLREGPELAWIIRLEIEGMERNRALDEGHAYFHAPKIAPRPAGRHACQRGLFGKLRHYRDRSAVA
jgi:hypothetical protein